MPRDTKTPIVISDGNWMHIRNVQAYHCRYPEVRGEGHTRSDALDHLANQLGRCLDFAPDRKGREEVEQAIDEVRSIEGRVTRGQIASIPRRYASFPNRLRPMMTAT